jgi:Arc/MetJ-type ribon-helix-helix transcriptional regulator
MVRKIRTSVALDKKQLDWIKEMVRRKRFASIAHGVEFAVERLMEEDNSDVHFRFAYDPTEIMALKKKSET